MIVENCGFLRDPRVRREAIALHSAGHRVSVICPMESRRAWHERIEGVSVYRFRPLRPGTSTIGYFIEYLYATVAIAMLSVVVLVREGFDLIHVSNPPDTLVVTTVLYKLLGKRIIYDQHDLCPELYRAKFARFSVRLLRFLLWLERWSYSLADHVITTNESYKQLALTRGRTASSKVSVVRNGPDLESLTALELDPKTRKRSKNIIVYTGVVGFQDGLDYLCRILHYLRFDLGRSDFCCILIGDGDALPRIKALTKELHLGEHMWFAGWIDDRHSYSRHLNAADICISPEPSNGYNNRSTFVKIMEYMAAGKPIVSFNLAETQFSAQDSAVYACDEADFAVQLARLMDDPSLRSAMGERGRHRIRTELAWQYSIPKLLAVYDQCLPMIKSDRSVPRNARAATESQ